VLVIQAPDERELQSLVTRVDDLLFQSGAATPPALPLEGRKLHVQTDWER